MFSYKWLMYSMGLSVSITPGFIIVTALGAQVPSDSSDPESLVIREEVTSPLMPATNVLDASLDLIIEFDVILDDE